MGPVRQLWTHLASVAASLESQATYERRAGPRVGGWGRDLHIRMGLYSLSALGLEYNSLRSTAAVVAVTMERLRHTIVVFKCGPVLSVLTYIHGVPLHPLALHCCNAPPSIAQCCWGWRAAQAPFLPNVARSI